MVVNALAQKGTVSFDNVWFVHAVTNGSCGKILILRCYETLEIQRQPGRVDYSAENAIYFSGAQEPANFPAEQRAIQPYRRGHIFTDIPATFSQLTITPTTNGSRFLAQKTKRRAKELFFKKFYGYALKYPGEYALICDTFVDLEQQLKLLLPNMGVPAEDVPAIEGLILGRLAEKL